MDKAQLEAAELSLKLYLEITIKDELVNLIKNKDSESVTSEIVADKINTRLRSEEKKMTQIVWNNVMKQMDDLTKEIK